VPDRYPSFFAFRDRLKRVDFHLVDLNPSDVAVLWQYVMNALYTEKDYGWVVKGCGQAFLSEMTRHDVKTIQHARRHLEEMGFIKREGRRVSILPLLDQLPPE
jgi:hypothetical protein